MRSARQQGLENIPRIFGNCHGQSFTGDNRRLWELTQWMPGAADYHQAPSTQRLQSALRALARLHVAWQASADWVAPPLRFNCSPVAASVMWPSEGPSPTVAERRQKLELSLQQQQSWRRYVFAGSALGNPIPEEAQRGSSQLTSSQPNAASASILAQQTLMHLAALGPELLRHLIDIQTTTVPLQFVLRDVWSDHILFTGDCVTGIIDFGAARIDEPATDVARLLGSLEPHDASRWLLGWEAYHAANPHVDLERVRVLDRVGTLLAAVQWLQWLVIEPRQFDVPVQQLLLRWQRLLQRLEAQWL